MVWFYPQTVHACLHDRKILSIPLWSDFISEVKLTSGPPITFFQSHYGLILSTSNFHSSLCYFFTFNPTMVWFYRRYNGKRGREHSWLSIPLWSDFIRDPNIGIFGECLCFQSHYGLILSRWSSSAVWVERASFNPTMVWFYLSTIHITSI